MSMVDTDERRGWVGKSDRSSELKVSLYGSVSQNPHWKFFLAAADRKSAPIGSVAPLAVAVLLVGGVEFHPLDGCARPRERWSTSSERPWRCSPAVRRKLQLWHPRPTVDPTVPFSPNTFSHTQPPPTYREII
jgi:hypothetical protein